MNHAPAPAYLGRNFGGGTPKIKLSNFTDINKHL